MTRAVRRGRGKRKKSAAAKWRALPVSVRRSVIANAECDAADGHSCTIFGDPSPGCDCAMRRKGFRLAVILLRAAAKKPKRKTVRR